MWKSEDSDMPDIETPAAVCDGGFAKLHNQALAAIDAALVAVCSHAAPTRVTSHATWEDDRGMNERVKRLRHQ